jgi:hypothetical protein
MKQSVLNFLGILSFFTLHSQESKSSAADSLLVKAVERSIGFDYFGLDSSGIVYIEVTKKADSLQVRTLYNSFKEYTPAIENSINLKSKQKYTQPIPHNYSGIVPIYFSIQTSNGNIRFPTKEEEATAQNAVNTIDNKSRILAPLKIVLYQPARKTAFNSVPPK